MLQYDMFETKEFVLIMQEVDKLRESMGSVRRGIYARVAELERLLKEERIKKEQAK